MLKGMSGKGGHRNFVKSYIDPGILFDTLSRHDDLLPQLEHMTMCQGIKALIQRADSSASPCEKLDKSFTIM